MEIGLHFIGYFLVFFFAFLYLPYLTFKTGAEYTVDLGRRRDSGEIEQFFAAVIPSTILNLLTVLWAWFGRAVGACSWRAVLDYRVMAETITGHSDRAGLSAHGSEIHEFILDEKRRPLLLYYLAALMIVSLLSGICYGYAFKRLTETPLLRDRVPKRPIGHAGVAKALRLIQWVLHRIVWLMLETVSVFSYFLWHPLFHAEVISLFPWSVQKPSLFVRMQNDRLYYGQFVRYDKSSTGDIESITISDVRRYCYDEVDERLAEGRLPLASFQGSLRINTKEIADIHNVPNEHFQHILERYRREMIRRLGSELLTAFAGQKGITVNDIYVQHARVNEMSRHRYRLALRKLEELNFIAINPTTLGIVGGAIPADTAVIDFPVRVQ